MNIFLMKLAVGVEILFFLFSSFSFTIASCEFTNLSCVSSAFMFEFSSDISVCCRREDWF